jgi:hypothetical protein
VPIWVLKSPNLQTPYSVKVAKRADTGDSEIYVTNPTFNAGVGQVTIYSRTNIANEIARTGNKVVTLPAVRIINATSATTPSLAKPQGISLFIPPTTTPPPIVASILVANYDGDSVSYFPLTAGTADGATPVAGMPTILPTPPYGSPVAAVADPIADTLYVATQDNGSIEVSHANGTGVQQFIHTETIINTPIDIAFCN